MVGAPASAPRIFPDVFQTAYVTNDFHRAIETFKEVCGVPSFHIRLANEIPHVTGGVARTNMAVAWVGVMQIEIIEPIGGRDELYRGFLPKDGYGLVFHHFCARARSIETFAARKADLSRRGCEIVFARDSGPLRMFYADTRRLFGHALEYVWLESDDLMTLNGQIPRY